MSRSIDIYIERTRNLDRRMPRDATFNLQDHYFEMNSINREYIINSDAERLQRYEEFRQYVDKRFDRIDRRFDGMERALSALLEIQGLNPKDYFEK